MTAPSLTNPPLGHHEPTGERCPRCGLLARFWLYNPLVRASHPHGGWLLLETHRCAGRRRPVSRRGAPVRPRGPLPNRQADHARAALAQARRRSHGKDLP